MTLLTEEQLLQLGYKKETWESDDSEEVVTWYNHGITLHEDSWKNPISYNFAGRTREDGTFKSGWVIKTVEQLKALENVLAGKI